MAECDRVPVVRNGSGNFPSVVFLISIPPLVRHTTMGTSLDDPNRFASDIEAPSIRARIESESELLDAMAKGVARADQAYDEAQARYNEIAARAEQERALFDAAERFRNEKRSQYTAQEEAVSLHRGLLHPLRRVPDDILALVFMQSVSEAWNVAFGEIDFGLEDAIAPKIAERRRRLPLDLAAVCRRWRNVMLTTPGTWASIEIHTSDVREDGDAGWLNVIAHFLARSGKHPLTICLVEVQSNHERTSLAEILTAALRTALQRCVALVLSVQTLSLMPWLMLGVPTPALRYLRVMCIDGLFVDPVYFGQSRAHQILVRSLESLQLKNAVFQCGEATSLVRNVAVTFTERWQDAALGHFLRDLRGVQSLRLRDVVLPLYYQPHEVVNFDQLAELSVYVQEQDAILAIRSHILSPNLIKLSVYGQEDTSVSRVDHTLSVGASCMYLSNVQLSRLVPEALHNLTTNLKTLHALAILFIHDTRFTGDALAAVGTALSPDPVISDGDADGPWPCPKLRQLGLVGCEFDKSCDDAAGTFLSFLRERLAAAGRSTKRKPGPFTFRSITLGGWTAEGSPQEEVNRLIKEALEGRKAAARAIGRMSVTSSTSSSMMV